MSNRIHPFLRPAALSLLALGSALHAAPFPWAFPDPVLGIKVAQVDPTDPPAAVPGIVRFTAAASYLDGPRDVTDEASWTVTGGEAKVLGPGLIEVLAPGPVILAAALDGKAGEATLTVTSAHLQALSVEGPGEVPTGLPVPLTVQGFFDDGSTQVVEPDSWNIAGPAQVSPDGLVTGTGAGTATLTATCLGVDSAPATVTVNPATLKAIILRPSGPILPERWQLVLEAEGLFSDDTIWPLDPAAVQWATTPAGNGVPGAARFLSGRPGVLVDGRYGFGGGDGDSVNVSASLDGATGQARVYLQDSIPGIPRNLAQDGIVYQVRPPRATIPVGGSQKFSWVAVWWDGYIQDWSWTADWSTTPGGIATAQREGVVKSLKVGDCTVRANDRGFGSGTAQLTVRPIATGITIAPGNPVIAVQTSLRLQASLLNEPGPPLPIDPANVTWSVKRGGTPTARVSVSNLPGDWGRVKAQGINDPNAQQGTATVVANYGAYPPAEVTVTVTRAQLQSLKIAPATATTIRKGSTQAYTATGTFQNPSGTQDLTRDVYWSAGGPAATLSNTQGSAGVATGAAVGETLVSAKFAGLASPPAVLDVELPPPASITVHLPVTQVNAGDTLQAFARGNYPSGPSADLVPEAEWSLVRTGGTVGGEAEFVDPVTQPGLIKGVRPGPVTVQVRYGGKTGTANFNVVAPARRRRTRD